MVKDFIYARNTLKDAKISKTKIGWFLFPRHDQASAVGMLKPGGLETAAPFSTLGTSVSSVSSVGTLQRFNPQRRMKNSAEDSGRYNRRFF
jgi:hypothetical protein